MSRKSAQGSTDKLRRRLESLASISKEVLAAHDIEVMLQDIVAEVKKSMDYDFSFCLVKDGECARLYHSLAPKLMRAISKATGLDFTGLEVHYDSEDIYWKSLARGKPLVTRNVLEESDQAAEGDKYLITDVLQFLEGFAPPNYTPRFVRKELRKARFAKVVQEELKIRSAITVPLRTKTGRNVGAFSIATRERVMNTDDVEVATLVGDLLSTAIENVRLSKMMRVERRVADTLREASQALASTREVNELLCLILEHLGRVVAYDTASLMLLSDGTLSIKAAAALGDKAPVMQLSLPLDTFPLNDELVKKKQPIVIADTKGDERWRAVPGNGKVRSWLGVPLLVKGQVIGCLTVNKWEPNYYREEDAQIAMAFANQVAIVIENTRLNETAKSERDRLTAIMSGMEDGVDVVSKDYIVKFQNRLLLERFGDLIGQLCYKGYMGLEEPCEFCPMVKAIETGEPHRVQLVAKDGRDYELISMPLRNPDGSVDAIEIVRDITEGKRAEEALRESEEKFRAIFESTREGMIISGPDGRILSANPATAAMLGYKSPEELVGMPAIELYADPEQRKTLFGELTEKSYAEDIELTFTKKDGTPIYVLGSGTIHRDKEGNILRVIGIFMDITERKRAEEALRESEKRYRSLFEDSPTSLFEEDWSDVKAGIESLRDSGVKDFRAYFENHPEDIARLASMVKIIDVNNATLNLYKATTREEYFDNLEKTFSEESYDVFGETLVCISEGKTTFVSELPNKTLKGDQKHISLRWSVPPPYRERLSKVFVSVMDITERKRVEEEIRRRNEELAALNAVTMAVTSTLDLQEVLHAIQERVMESLGEIYPPLFFLFNEEDQTLKVVPTRMQEQGLRRVERLMGVNFEEVSLPLATLNPALREALLAGRPCQTDDLSDLSELGINRKLMKDAQRELEIKSIVGLPLWVKGKFVGTMLLFSQKEGMPDEGIELLSAIANQVAIAIENARLYGQAQAHSAYLATLLRINATLRSTLSLSQVLETIVQCTSEALGYVGSLITVPDAKVEQLVLGAVWGGRFVDAAVRLTGLKVESFSLPLKGEENPIVRTYLTGEVQTSSGEPGRIVVGLEPALSSKLARAIERRMGAKLAASVPLPVGDKVVGVLTVFSPREQLPDEERAMLLGLADQAGVAIENARLYEETRRRAEELAALYDVFLDVAAQLELPTLLKTIVQRAVELLEGQAGGLYLYDHEGQDLELVVHQGLHKDYTGSRLALGEGACGRVARSGEPLVVTDYANWEERSPHFADEPTFNVLAVPIKRGDTLLGALYVDDPDVERRFEEGDIRLAVLFANQAAIAIEKAQLFGEVERTRDYLENLIESSPDAIVTTDRQGKITLFSKGAESLFGYKASEVIAQPVSNYYPDGREVMRIMRRLLREGRLRNYEMEVIDKNGKAIPVILSASLLRDEKGAITGTLGIVKDITARKGLEEELRQYAEHLEEMVDERTKALISLNEQLDKANHLKSEFVSAVSHELRAPLFAIVGMSEMLLDRGVKDRGWTMEYLQIINEQGNRLARLIDDLLDLSRIESGKQVYDWESVQLDEVIKESIQFLKAQAKEKGLAISHRIEKDLPPVEADRDRMRQVLINLISNSLNYSNEGAKVKVFARQLTVRRGPKRGEKIVAVSVTDSGWGIPPEDLPHIFEKFYRGNEHQRRTKGSGLGLALVKEIVAAHGGTIEVKSKVGKGSKFTLRLSLAS